MNDIPQTQLVLSLFPGIGLLDRAFESEGFCVVRGPDVLWGGDIRGWHPPAGRFDGVIGGLPCQCFSQLRFLVQANGYEPRFGNLIPEFERCVAKARPRWFLMENVRGAPIPSVAGYGVHEFLINNRQFGAAQNRVRRFSFGWRGGRRVLMVDVVPLENPKYEPAACGGSTGSSLGAAGWDGGKDKRRRVGKRFRTGTTCLGQSYKTSWAFEEIKRKQGLPEDFDLPPFKVAAKCEAVGNGVPLPMGRGIAKAVKEAVEGPK